MLTAFGLSAMTMHEASVPEEPNPPTRHKDLPEKMLEAGDQCIAFWEEHAHTKGIGITPNLMNFIPSTLFHREPGPSLAGTAFLIGCRLTQPMQMRVRLCRELPRSPAAGLSHRVCNRTFASGLRHEPKRDLSFIQTETCRMLFWHAYTPDKKLVTSSEGPPMINGKFCLCQVPLDQEDDK